MAGGSVRAQAFTRANLIAGIMLAATCPALGQTWPARPMTMVVPFAAGSSSDIVGRIVAPRLSELLGQQVIVENVGGAGGMTGANRVAKAAPDGYQFVLGTGGTHATNQTLYRNPQYNAATDFAPVALIVEQTIVLVARKNLPASNLQEFGAYAKSNQAEDAVRLAWRGLCAASLLRPAQCDPRYQRHPCSLPRRPAGHPGPDRRPDRLCMLLRYGRDSADREPDVKALAILTKDRSPSLPALASAHEQGLTNFHASTWYGIFLPKRTPAPIVQKLHGAVIATMNTPAVQERLKETGTDLVGPERRSPEYLAKFVVSEIDRWAAVIKSVGLSVD